MANGKSALTIIVEWGGKDVNDRIEFGDVLEEDKNGFQELAHKAVDMKQRAKKKAKGGKYA